MFSKKEEVKSPVKKGKADEKEDPKKDEGKGKDAKDPAKAKAEKEELNPNNNANRQIELKAGDYRILVHILEAKDIKVKPKTGAASFLASFEGEQADPMVEVEVMGQSQCTDYKAGQMSPVFNSQLFFEYKNLSVDDLETGMIKIVLLDHDAIGYNNFIGQFTVDVSYIYKMNKEHELYKMWVAMNDIYDETQQINGLLKLSINVMGPGDKPPVHDPSKGLKDRENNGANRLFVPGRVKLEGHMIKFALFRAEHLAPLDLIANTVDSYGKISFAGQKAETKVVKSDRNPEYYQELSIACKLPCMNNKIKVEIWDSDPLRDERVGTYYYNFKSIMNAESGARWANLYGPPLHAEGEQADLMTKFSDKGSTYRGRFLYSIMSKNEEAPKSGTKDIKFVFPSKPCPNPRERSYTLKIALYEGIELPEREEFCLHIACGPYEMKSKVVKNDNSRAVWDMALPDLLIKGPDNAEDIYDVIIYLATGVHVTDRICFIRLKAKDLLDVAVPPRSFDVIDKFLLQEDKSLDMLDDEEFPGIIYARIKLYSKEIEDAPFKLFHSKSVLDMASNLTNKVGEMKNSAQTMIKNPLSTVKNQVGEIQNKVGDIQNQASSLVKNPLQALQTLNIPPVVDEVFYKDYLIHVHLFMGRDFPAADETGAADPFIIVRCQGKKAKSRTKYETLNPGFFETVELVVSLPPLKDSRFPAPGLSLLVYDEDQGMLGEKKDLLGRIWIDLDLKPCSMKTPEGNKDYKLYSRQDPKWYDLIFDATNQKEGKLLVGYDIIPLADRNYFPLEKVNIRPKVNPGVISIAMIGVRDVLATLNLFPVKKVFCKFDISGDTKEAVITNKHPVIGGSCNLLEILSVDIDVPDNLEYAPVLTVYVYDNFLGIMGSRLLGVTNIPLQSYCEEITKKKYESSRLALGQSIKNSLRPEDIRVTFGNNKAIKEEIKDENGPGWTSCQPKAITSQQGPLTSKFVEPDVVQNYSIDSSDEKKVKIIDAEELNKLKQNLKKKQQVELYKKKVMEDERIKLEEQNKKQEALKKKQEELKKRKVKAAPAFMQNQDDYDSQPDEDLDMTPAWMKRPEPTPEQEKEDQEWLNYRRPIVEDELEDTLGHPPFDTWKILRGQSRGKANFLSKTVTNNKQTTGVFKSIIKIKDKHEISSQMDEDLVEYMTPKNVIVRLYVLKGKSLTPKDTNTSDPYLIIKLGDKIITDKKSLRSKTNNPNFYTSYDLMTSLPGPATLSIECWDDDGFDFPDFIGATKIDLEDRFFNKEWQQKYKILKPIEERTLFTDKTSAPQGVLQCWVDIIGPKEAAANPKIDISPLPKEEFELRVIIWGTRDVIFADELTKCNDLFLKGILGSQTLETDTHWRCRKLGSFNWRFKFPMSLPLDPDEDYGKDVLTLQMWDRDITKANDVIGEAKIELNSDMFKMLEKAYKRKGRMVMKKHDKTKDMKKDKFWISFTHPEKKDTDDHYIPQGYAEISLEIVPKHIMNEQPTGMGRDPPNQSPCLPEPTGRFTFDIFSPWKMIKEILGPALARKICCFVFCTVFCVLFIYWGFFFGGNLVANLITKSIS